MNLGQYELEAGVKYDVSQSYLLNNKTCGSSFVIRLVSYKMDTSRNKKVAQRSTGD